MINKLLILVAIVALFQYWGDIKRFVSPPPDFGTAHDGKVILYATSWCGYCAKARELLDKHKVEYFEYDIENSPEGSQQYKALGGRGVPVLLINGKTVKGYNPELILKLVKP